MKKFLIMGIFAIAVSAQALAALPPVLAKVNGTDVTRAEIEKAFANLTEDQPGMKKIPFDKTPPDFQKAFVDKYIEKMLIIEAGEKAGLQDDPEIKQKLKEAEEFLVQQKFLTNLVIAHKSDAELHKIYDEKLKNKEGKQEVHAFHILVASEDEAKKIRQQIADGGDFEKIAKAKSTEPGAKVNGGDLGYFTEDQMVPEFSHAAFALKVGEISQPVQTSFGWHIIKVVDKRTKKIPSFAESKTALEGQLTNDVIEDEVKRLRVGADIKYFGTLAKPAEAPTVKPLIKKVDDKGDIKPAEPKKADDKPVTTSNINKEVKDTPKIDAVKLDDADKDGKDDDDKDE